MGERVALAHDVSMRALNGRPTLELGCGLGLPSIAAAQAAGGCSPPTGRPTRCAPAANAERNEVQVEVCVLVGRA